MSVVNHSGEKVTLPRDNAPLLWRRIIRYYRREKGLGRSERRLKYLAAYGLRMLEWSQDDIAKVLGVPQTTLSYQLDRLGRQLREQFEAGES